MPCLAPSLPASPFNTDHPAKTWRYLQTDVHVFTCGRDNFLVCALTVSLGHSAGFLIAYNHPPGERGMFSVQIVLQFLSVMTVFLSAPSLTREGIAWMAAMVTFTILHQVR